MRRPLSIAMMISVTVHAVALAIVFWLIRDTTSFGAPNYLTVDLRQPAARADSPAETQSGSEVPTPETVATAKGPSEPEADPAVPKQPRPAARLPDPSRPIPAERVEEAGVARSDSATPSSKSESAAERVPATPEEKQTQTQTLGERSDTALPGTDPTSPVQQVLAARILARPRPIAAVTVEDAPVARFDSVTPPPKSESMAGRVALTPEQEKRLTQKLEEWTEAAFESSRRESPLIWNDQGREYLVELMRADVFDDTRMPRLVVRISTTEGDHRLTTEVHLKSLGFSNYAQFVNRWDPNVYLRDDMFDGRFHSNSEINLAYDENVSPHFFGKVTTAERAINIDSGRLRPDRSKVFLGGLETGVRSIHWPNEAFQMPDEDRFADYQIHRFDADTRIAFKSDGSFSWEVLGPEPVAGHVGHLQGTSYLIAEKNAALHIKGTVRGQVLVYSPERIVIEGELAYARDPVRFSDSEDFLGLVSDKNIEIAPTTVTGRGDLVIDAAMYAGQELAVRDYRSDASGSLLIFGSLTAGSISATEPRYKTRIMFDRRLENRRPPGFPMTNRYVVEFWDSGWQAEAVETLH